MSDSSHKDISLSFSQKILLICLSIILVISLFFIKSGFKATATLDELAKNSLIPEQALSNGRPTVFEFYADWCEACKEMAPAMKDVKARNLDKVDLVLLNVDNPRWIDLIDKYDVNGIPKLTFFDENGKVKGFSLGVKESNELNDIFLALINNLELPHLINSLNSSKLNSNADSISKEFNNIKLAAPRDHN